MDELVIRHADLDNPNDQTAMLNLLDNYAKDIMGNGSPLPAKIKSGLVEGMKAHPTTLVLLAFVGKEPAGLCNCFLGFSTFAAKPLLNVHDLAVETRFRGRGIGRKLLERVESIALEKGCCKVTLEVRDDNVRAQKLYEKLGFNGAGESDKLDSMWFLQKKLA